jgi:hypothetical protein
MRIRKTGLGKGEELDEFALDEEAAFVADARLGYGREYGSVSDDLQKLGHR